MHIKIGDRIKFRVTVREGTKTATRVVTGFYFGNPEVGFNSHRGFIVRRSEILAVDAACPRGGTCPFSGACPDCYDAG